MLSDFQHKRFFLEIDYYSVGVSSQMKLQCFITFLGLCCSVVLHVIIAICFMHLCDNSYLLVARHNMQILHVCNAWLLLLLRQVSGISWIQLELVTSLVRLWRVFSTYLTCVFPICCSAFFVAIVEKLQAVWTPFQKNPMPLLLREFHSYFEQSKFINELISVWNLACQKWSKV